MSTDSLDSTAERRRRHAVIRAEVAEEEARVGKLEAAETSAAPSERITSVADVEDVTYRAAREVLPQKW